MSQTLTVPMRLRKIDVSLMCRFLAIRRLRGLAGLRGEQRPAQRPDVVVKEHNHERV
jgi:hypothetical protein